MRNPLLVTDAGLARLDLVGNAVELCRAAGLGCAVFSDVKPNPVEENVTAGVSAYRAGGHDGVIAFGGGSALDTGKAIALMVGQSRPIWDFEDREDWYKRVNVAGMAPVVAVPTTAGTGSEVGRCSVLTDLRDHTKKLIFHPRLLPAIVIEDPELHTGLPSKITAAVGMDALSHNLEAFCAPTYHPLADGIAVEGMRLIKDWLPAACRDGANLEARAQMLIASTMGATAFQKGLGAMHSLSHPCSANLDTHHGLTNGVVMPYVLVFNRRAIKDKMKRLAAYLGLRRPSFGAVLDWVVDLRATIGIPEHARRARCHRGARSGVREDGAGRSQYPDQSGQAFAGQVREALPQRDHRRSLTGKAPPATPAPFYSGRKRVHHGGQRAP